MEGAKVLELLLKLLTSAIMLVQQIVVQHLKNRQRKKELGMKGFLSKLADKIDVKIAKNIKKNLEVREKTIGEQLRDSKFKLGCYKLENQNKLTELDNSAKLLINKLEKKKDPDQIKRLEKDLHKATQAKTDFEKELNRTLLKKEHEVNKIEHEYNKIKENIDLCTKTMNGLESDRKHHMTQSMRDDFKALIDQQDKSQKEPDYDKDAKEKEQSNDIENEIKMAETAEVVNDVVNDIEQGIEKDFEKDFINETDKQFTDHHEKETKTHLKEEKHEKHKDEKNKDDEFTKKYLEKQKNKSLAKNVNKDVSMER